ncbi:hypothetical protein [Saccharospirillum impatiens]|uniref:hypothetical protein n=1 Tax=Saccharospirillum impatiens TaxID=169438 RepID=UPI000419E7D3|nr:hypothetical protein [Saccharospirillum impatiens]
MIYGPSDIIVNSATFTLSNGEPAEQIWLRGGTVLVISATALALYKDEAAIGDPLGNGLIALTDLSGVSPLAHQDGHFMTEHRAGYIGLHGERLLLITPVAIQLFDDRRDALQNRNERARLPLE